ncbi:MAG: glycosyltransferase, partial [Flavobacteriaceae bacterium]
MENKVQVSVCMITYKHEAFIEQAITSILDQETNFEFNLIISNDASPDRTDALIKEIKSSHPKGHRIAYYYQKENLGMHQNFIFALNQCHGKYVALCEGDDYWTDPKKLQTQFDFLESHPDFEVCFSNISIIDSKGKIVKEELITNQDKTVYEHKDMPFWCPTLTRLYRNRDLSEILTVAPGLDMLMLTYQTRFGKAKFMTSVMGHYRLHEEGIYSAKSAAQKKEHMIITLFESLKVIDPDLNMKYYGMILKKLVEMKPLSMD